MQLPRILSKRGFTLIELLVVITIIIILAAVVMIAINPAEMARRGRDATRLSDLENVRKAIDLGVAEGSITDPDIGAAAVACPAAVGCNSQTPPAGSARTCSGANWVGGLDLCAYLATLPIDPTNDATYHYEFSADGAPLYGYELRCQLESATNDSKEADDGGDDAAWYEVGTDQGLDLL